MASSTLISLKMDNSASPYHLQNGHLPSIMLVSHVLSYFRKLSYIERIDANGFERKKKLGL